MSAGREPKDLNCRDSRILKSLWHGASTETVAGRGSLVDENRDMTRSLCETREFEFRIQCGLRFGIRGKRVVIRATECLKNLGAPTGIVHHHEPPRLTVTDRGCQACEPQDIGDEVKVDRFS